MSNKVFKILEDKYQARVQKDYLLAELGHLVVFDMNDNLTHKYIAVVVSDAEYKNNLSAGEDMIADQLWKLFKGPKSRVGQWLFNFALKHL